MIKRRNYLNIQSRKQKQGSRKLASSAVRACTYVIWYVLAMRHGHLAGASLVTEICSPPEFFLVPGFKIPYRDFEIPIGIPVPL